MTSFEVLGIILVVVIVLFLKNKSKIKKAAFILQREAANASEMEEQKIEIDNNSETLIDNSNSLHWTSALLSEVENEPDLSNTPFSNKLNEVINKIIAIPHDLHELGNKSLYQLVVESGYIEVHDQITKGVILDALTKEPSRIDEWLQYSEDQRVSEGWFLREDNKIWNIGTFSTKNGYKESLTQFPNLRRACANFIKLKVEYTRKLIEEDDNKKKKKKGKHP